MMTCFVFMVSSLWLISLNVEYSHETTIQLCLVWATGLPGNVASPHKHIP